MTKDSLTVHLDEEGPQFLVLHQGVEKTKALIKTNLSGASIGVQDLERAVNPAGKATKWEIPGLGDENESVSEIAGVIIGQQPYRVYWKGEYAGGGEQPDCMSIDMMEGSGDPGGPCADCPYNQWGSGKTPNSKACQERSRVFILRESEMLPMVLTLSPINSGAVRRYGLRLLNKKQIGLNHVVSKLRLEQAKSPSGFDYAKVIVSLDYVLPPEMQNQMESYAQYLLPQLLNLEIVEEDAEEVPF